MLAHVALSGGSAGVVEKTESHPKVALGFETSGGSDQPLMRAVPERPSFLTHCTIEPLRLSL
jgi:hypothetical protein